MSIEEIFQTMRELVAEQFSMDPDEVSMETSFEEDLGAEFEVGETQEEDLSALKTVGDAVNYIAGKLK